LRRLNLGVQPKRRNSSGLIHPKTVHPNDDLLASLPPQRHDEEAVREVRWMIEELRVSLFAQDLRTPYPISDVRLFRILDALRDR